MLKEMRKFMQTPYAFPFLDFCFASLPLPFCVILTELSLLLAVALALAHSFSMGSKDELPP